MRERATARAAPDDDDVVGGRHGCLLSASGLTETGAHPGPRLYSGRDAQQRPRAGRCPRMSHPAVSLDILTPEAIALAWRLEPAVVVPVAVAAALYVRGWAALRERMPERFGSGTAAAFAAGLAAVLVALCSPIDALGHRLLQIHMIQHLLLMV